MLIREDEEEGEEEEEKEMQPPPVMSMVKIEVYWSLSKAEREELKKTAELKAALKAQEAKEAGERGSNLEKLRAETMAEQELLLSKFETELELLEQSLMAKEILRSEYDQISIARAKQFADEINTINQKSADAEERIENAKNQAKMNAVSSTFSNLASLMNTSSKKLFAIGKASAIAGAIVDGYAAVQKTMASVPYPFNIPLAAAQAVSSAVQVQGIAKTKIGGASGGASTFSGGVPTVNTSSAGAGGGGQAVQQIDIAGFDSNKFYSGDQLGSLFAAINTGQSQGYRIAVNGGG